MDILRISRHPELLPQAAAWFHIPVPKSVVSISSFSNGSASKNRSNCP